MPVKRLFTLLLLFMSSLLAGLFLCEMLVRVVAPQRVAFSLGIYESDPDLLFKLRPDMNFSYDQAEFSVPVETNSLGFRDKEIEPKQDGIYRVLGVGDSFSFANGVHLEETYFKQLEQCLNTGRSGGIEIINGGVPAYSLIQEKRFAKKYGEKLEADAILVGFYIGNDFTDSMELFDENDNPLIEVRDHNLRSLKERDQEENFIRSTTGPVRTYLAVRSHLYTFFRNRLSELLAKLKLRAPIPPPEFMEIEYSPHMEEAWETTRQLLISLSEFTDESGMDLFVVALPAIYQVHHDSWGHYADIHSIDPTLYDPDKPQKLLSGFLEQQNIEFIDMLPKLREAGVHESLYYPVDSHMNATGHRIVADSLCSYMAPHLQIVQQLD